MSKLSISLCAIFLVSVVFAEKSSVMKNCDDSIQEVSMLISKKYDQIRFRNQNDRTKAWQIYEAGMDGLEKIRDYLKKMEMMTVHLVHLRTLDIGTVTIKCSKEIGERVYNHARNVIEGLEKLV